MKNNKIDWLITIIPLISIIFLSILFFIFPQQSNTLITNIRFLLGNTLGSYYLIIGLGIFIFSIYISFSKYGNVVIGEKYEKPKYSFFSWGAMMFTAGLAADILFYSFSEWILYATDPYVISLGDIETWASTYPIFHWSLIPWSFYLVLAVSFGFMLHVRKRDRQKFSEACRPILKSQTTGIIGRIIDLLAVFALIAGTATTFGLATPLMSSIILELFSINIDRNILTVILLIITFITYTYSLMHGIKGINILAKLCIYLFFGLLIFVFIFGGEARYIIDLGLSSIGNMFQNFIHLSTYTDPARTYSFPQNWTIFYWAYWMVWCVAAPFFIGSISQGRTIRQTILGGYAFGAGSTILSFIVLGNYSLAKQINGSFDFIGLYLTNQDLYTTIITMIKSLPLYPFVLFLTLITMILFYATSFDSIALIASKYSYKTLKNDEKPNKVIMLIWCILLIALPIAFVFSQSSLNNIQSISIIAAFPIGIVIVLITSSFFIDLKRYLNNK